MKALETMDCDLTVIGAGMAGMAAAVFAANRGLSTVQVGRTGEIVLSTGFLDLMGVHPVEEKKQWEDPWAAIEALTRDIPKHPYSRLGKEEIRSAFEEVLEFLVQEGLHYERREHGNSLVLTPLGTIKPTYGVPATTWHGVAALEQKTPCLIVDFQGLRGFSSRQISATLGDRWQELRHTTIPFPGTFPSGEILPAHMANALSLAETRERLIGLVRPRLGEAEAVGMPAIFGPYRTREIHAHLQEGIGVPLFEIPTMPPSVPGIRLKEAFEEGLSRKGVRLFYQKRVLEATPGGNGHFLLGIGGEKTELTLRSRGVILASGRFLGRGLHAERNGIRETIFDLPVLQPPERADWHRKDFLDPGGHPINRAGLDVDDRFRPLDRSGDPVFRNLFAAGSILAHQDWIRMKCGAGLAIATAYGAVNAFVACCAR